jgi:hypothetical protein
MSDQKVTSNLPTEDELKELFALLAKARAEDPYYPLDAEEDCWREARSRFRRER